MMVRLISIGSNAIDIVGLRRVEKRRRDLLTFYYQDGTDVSLRGKVVRDIELSALIEQINSAAKGLDTTTPPELSEGVVASGEVVTPYPKA